jgi:TolB-like protein
MRAIATLLIAIACLPSAVCAASSTERVRIAIMLFEIGDDRPTQEQNAIARRVSEGLRERLSADPILDVVPTERMREFGSNSDARRAAGQLDADFIATGRVSIVSTARSDQVLRTYYELFDVEMGTPIWSHNIDQDLSQIDELIVAAAAAIRRAIPSRALPQEAPAAGFQPLPIAPPSVPRDVVGVGPLVVVPAYSDRSEAGTSFASAATSQMIQILRQDHGVDVADLSESMLLAAGRFDSPIEIVNSTAYDYEHALVLELTSPPEVSVYAVYFRGSDGTLWQEGYAASEDVTVPLSDIAATVAALTTRGVQQPSSVRSSPDQSSPGPNNTGNLFEAQTDGVVVATSEDELDSRNGTLFLRRTGEPFTGVIREWHSNGQINAEAPFQDGVVHGPYREWLRDGTLIVDETYDMGSVITSGDTPDDGARRSAHGQRNGGVQSGSADRGRLEDRRNEAYGDSRTPQGQRTDGRIDSGDDRRLRPVPPPRLSRAEEERILRNAGMDLSDARLWLNAGFTSHDVLAWRPFVNSYRHQGRNNLEEASNWWRWGWTPELASYFIHDLCGRYRQAAAQGTILTPQQVIDRFGDQCRH